MTQATTSRRDFGSNPIAEIHWFLSHCRSGSVRSCCSTVQTQSVMWKAVSAKFMVCSTNSSSVFASRILFISRSSLQTKSKGEPHPNTLSYFFSCIPTCAHAEGPDQRLHQRRRRKINNFPLASRPENACDSPHAGVRFVLPTNDRNSRRLRPCAIQSRGPRLCHADRSEMVSHMVYATQTDDPSRTLDAE
jgi:hypothetical protein